MWEKYEGAGFPHSSRQLARIPPNRNDPNGYYRLLGVPPYASIPEIKKAYREWAKQYHPDAECPDEESFLQLTAIYEVLSDPVKKREYDSTPPDSIYISHWEESIIRQKHPSVTRGEFLTKREDKTDLPWSYFHDGELTEVAQEWYPFLLEAMYWHGYQDVVRVWVGDLDTPWTVLQQRGWKLFRFDQAVEPNWVTAFSAVRVLV
ncbi:J domain-containing protein [Streptomyces sp. CoH17]|uniref:J domain-containing protein n=1 Tax=Streptomyces sp. CoH17 TaxID=2992806 RepID=UPI00226D5645|nr:J domain-containing protein [Streptomyces sp. CoH17]